MEVGDIVLAAMHNYRKMIVHRIIARENDRYQVKGDNNMESDGWFYREDILGRVETIEFNGRQNIPAPWANKLIAWTSKLGLLNYFLLPSVRTVKKLYGYARG